METLIIGWLFWWAKQGSNRGLFSPRKWQSWDLNSHHPASGMYILVSVLGCLVKEGLSATYLYQEIKSLPRHAWIVINYIKIKCHSLQRNHPFNLPTSSSNLSSRLVYHQILGWVTWLWCLGRKSHKEGIRKSGLPWHSSGRSRRKVTSDMLWWLCGLVPLEYGGQGSITWPRETRITFWYQAHAAGQELHADSGADIQGDCAQANTWLPE